MPPSRRIALLLAPVAVWLASLAWRALRRRGPARAGVTVELSLLTLGYFLLVVGTGIFWVAVQELPVFDWHYLPGYILLGLTLAHIALHWRNVAAWLRRKAPAALVDSTKGRFAGSVRWASYGLLAVLCLGLAFMLGVRQGGHEVTVVTSEAAHATSDLGKGALVPPHLVTSHGRSLTLAQLYHEGSSYPARVTLPGMTVRAAPPPVLEYDGPATQLAPAAPDGGPSVVQAYDDWRAGRFRDPDRDMTFEELSVIVHHAQGASGAGGTGAGGPRRPRTAASAGALYPVNVYVATHGLKGLSSGLYYYHPERDALVRLQTGRTAAFRVYGATGSPGAQASSVTSIVLTASFDRTAFKYGVRSYRYAAMDTGHVAYDVALVAASLGWRAATIGRFDDPALEDLLAVDPSVEAPLLVISLAQEDHPGAEPLFKAAAASKGPQSFVELVHGAGSIEMVGGTGPLPLRPTGASEAEALRADVVLPAPAEGLPLIAAIRTRRSVRKHSDVPLTLPELSTLLAASAAEGGAPTADPFLQTSAPLHLYAVVRNVTGLSPGVYRYLPGRHALSRVRSGDFSRDTEAACEDQSFCGTADVVVVMTVRWADMVLPDGDRGYRYAHLRAGMVGQGLYVGAAALDLAPCGVGAFRDLDAARLVGVDPTEEPALYLVAIGKKG